MNIVIAVNSSIAQRNHPVLYWVTLVYIVGLPNFLEFDPTGRTHDFGMFNLTSISRITLTLLVAYVFIVVLAVSRTPIFPRKVKVSAGLWVLLLVWCTITSILQPESRLSPHLATDLPLSLFRLAEWVLAFVLFLALYAHEPAESATSLVVDLIGRSSWISIMMVWVALPFFPHLVYGMDEAGGSAALGGEFLLPAILAFEASIGFYYSLFFFRPGLSRWLGCAFALLTLEMTHSRTYLVAIAAAFVFYALFFPRKPSHRGAAIACILAIVASLTVFRQEVVTYFAHGLNTADVATLDSRTYVWQASLAAFAKRPVLGYGFLVGPKYAIKDHWTFPHWIPPNAHSDFIEALLIGGIPAFTMLVYIYVAVLWRSLRAAGRGPLFLFLLLALSQVVLHSIFAGEGLMMPFGSQGAVLLLCWIALADYQRSWPVAKEHSEFFVRQLTTS